MTARSFREPSQPAPEKLPEWPRMHRCSGICQPPRRDVVAKLVARATAAAEVREAGK